jgi:surface protein
MSRAYQSSRLKIPAKPFISTWNTATTYTGSTANNQIRLPLISTGTYKFTVNWGDSTSDNITTWNQAEVTHTYAAPGTYTVTITGFIKGWDFSGFAATAGAVTGDRRKLLSVTQFGCLEIVTYTSLTTTSGAFYGCTNLNLTAVVDQPNFKNCTSTAGFLRDCAALTTVANVNKWDVSKITSFRSTFRDCPSFDDNVGNWNTSKGEDFGLMFRGNTTNPLIGSFTNGGSSSIGNWDMRNATSLVGMFIYQRFFDQNIGNWDVSNVTDMSFMFVTYWSGNNPTTPINAGYFNNGGSDSIKNWDTSNVTTMSTMFSGALVFNQPIENWNTSNVTNMSYMLQARDFNRPINVWDVSKVTTMSRMLQGNTSLGISFNQPLNNWKIPLVTDMINFMRSGTDPHSISVENYSNFLIALSQQPLKPNVQLGVNQQYNASAVSARAILTSAPNNWTITDFGLQP